MPAALRNLPLRRKVAAIAIVNVATALVLGSWVVLLWDVAVARRELVSDVTSQAEIVAANTTAALAFADPDAGQETLSAFRATPGIEQACLYDVRGRPFAQYVDTGAPACADTAPPDGAQFLERAFLLVRPVTLEDRRIGTVVLRSSLAPVNDRLRAQVLGLGLALATASLVVLMLAARLHRVVTDPILSLADTARAVSKRRDYSLRATKLGDDEVGHLVDAFNGMLEEIQRREVELQAANELLEQRVAERTLALRDELAERRRAEALLAERNAELVRTNQDLDDFAYIASHDLREPLRGIHRYSSFLAEDYGTRLDEDGLAKLQTLQRLSRRMEDLIESLLHYSRLGRTDLAFTPVDLTAVVDDVLESLEIGLREDRIAVRVQRPLPVVRCDRVRVAEVFRNLITNAMKYNDKPERWIEIGAKALEGRGRVLFVRDNGIGIPDKHRETVFRIFKRLHPRDRFGGGTGAGLTIVRKIVERHQGEVWIDSIVGQGTTVCFTLEQGTPHVHDSVSHRPAGGG